MTAWMRPVALLLFALAILGFGAALSTVFVKAAVISNEGWNALHALHAMTWPNLYQPDGYANFPNYPPLSFYLIGWLGRIFGDLVFIGRIVSFLGTLTVAGGLWLVVRNMGGRPWTGAFAAALYLVLTLCTARYYVVVNDPQMLGHAFQIAGLVLLTARPRPGLWRLVAVALLMLLGGLVKANLIVLPLAITLWLALRDRRALLVWIGAGAGLSAIAVAICYAAFGSAVFAQVLGHERYYSLELIGAALRWTGPFLAYGVIGILAARRLPEVPAASLFVIYVVLSLLFGLFFAGGNGVSLNTMFDLSIAVIPLAALALERLADLPRRARIATAVFAALPLLWLVPVSFEPYWERTQRADELPRNEAAVRLLAASSGPVVCADPTLCYWAGKDNYVDISNTTQKLFRGGQPAFEAAMRAAPPAIMHLGSGNGLVVRTLRGLFETNYVKLMDPPELILAAPSGAPESN